MSVDLDPGSDAGRSDAVRVFTYVKDVIQQLSTRAVHHLDKYESVLWLHRLAEQSGCRTCFTGNGTGSHAVWASVAKRTEPRAPEVPVLLRPWIVSGSGVSEQVPPRLADRIPDPSGEQEPDGQIRWLEVEDVPSVITQFEAYCNGPWKAWAASHTDWLRFQDSVYRPLFRLHQELTRLGEEHELILGMGCLSWCSDGIDICRHLVSIRASLALDPATGEITIGPSPDRTELKPELDMLPAQSRPSREVAERINHLLAESDGDPTARAGIDGAIRAVLHSLDGDYEPRRMDCDSPRARASATFAPAVVLRRRSGAGRLTFFESVAKQLNEGAEIPGCVKQLVQEREEQPMPGGSSRSKGGEPALERTYFPLPANDDQVQIAERISMRNGVLVQGPPGTGKSHTITNLLCHLLANGKRVLVTAQTPRALEVLRDKIRAVPGEGGIVDLCVSMVGDDRGAQGDLERSVANIIERKNRWETSKQSESRKLAEMELDLTALEKRRDALRGELRRLAEADAKMHNFGEFATEQTVQRLAELTYRLAPRYDWLEDRPGAVSVLEVTAVELEELRGLAGEISAELASECTRCLPIPGTTIPATEVLAKWFAILDAGRAKFGETDPPESVRRHRASAHWATLQSVDSLSAAVSACAFDGQEKWQLIALRDVLNERSGRWKVLLETTRATVAKLEPEWAALSSESHSLPPDKSIQVLRADVSDLVRHLVEERRSLGFWFLRPAVVRRTRYVMETCILDGQRTNTPAALQALARYLAARSTLENCWAHWRPLVSREPANLGLRLAMLREFATTLERILDLVPAVQDAKKSLALTYPEALVRISQERALAALTAECRERFEWVQYSETSFELSATAKKCRSLASAPSAHALSGEIAAAIEAKDLNRISHGVCKAEQLLRVRSMHARQLAVQTKIARQLPKLAARISTNPCDERWQARFAELAGAFQWAQSKRWIDTQVNGNPRQQVADDLRCTETRILELTGQLAAARAWKSCFEAMSETHRRSLVQWQQAIAKLGKGTGAHAHKWRRAARMELDRCKDAIPAWIMPLYRVFETVPPSPGLFDVVIIDEASQCGLDGLGLLFIGKKLIVVGDNEQISPSNVGVEREDVDRILQAQLGHMRSRQSFDIENSLFDHAARLFDARVTLREHFRCVPDIIRFSNGLSYNNRLIPLRQYASKPLAPLVPHYTPHGSSSGSSGRKANYNEADALVSAVIACCKDKAYEGKTMGVISLLGDHQASYIEQQLLRNLGPEEMLRRKLICGDAYSFQGDERHVIFLSMVASGSSGIKALTGRADKQRFNVAASRAQDQCWLFHSVQASEISNNECVRKQLLTHFCNPAQSVAESEGIDVNMLRSQLAEPRKPDSPPPPFDSWFEVEVYLRIVDRGFVARVQYPAGAYRIDIVIEGGTRLAVECDGDRWHGPERFDEDLRRQRQLERVGWRFWRVSGSDFYRDPDQSMLGLWRRLEELGIEPAREEQGNLSLVGHVAQFAVPAVLSDSPLSDSAPSSAEEIGVSDPSSTTDPSWKRNPVPTPERTEPPEQAEIRLLQEQLRALWRRQGKGDKAVPSSKLRLLQLIEESAIAASVDDPDSDSTLD